MTQNKEIRDGKKFKFEEKFRKNYDCVKNETDFMTFIMYII